MEQSTQIYPFANFLSLIQCIYLWCNFSCCCRSTLHSFIPTLLKGLCNRFKSFCGVAQAQRYPGCTYSPVRLYHSGPLLLLGSFEPCWSQPKLSSSLVATRSKISHWYFSSYLVSLTSESWWETSYPQDQVGSINRTEVLLHYPNQFFGLNCLKSK